MIPSHLIKPPQKMTTLGQLMASETTYANAAMVLEPLSDNQVRDAITQAHTDKLDTFDIWEQARYDRFNQAWPLMRACCIADKVSPLMALAMMENPSTVIGLTVQYSDHPQWSAIEKTVIEHMNECVSFGVTYTQTLIDAVINPTSIQAHALPELDIAFG